MLLVCALGARMSDHDPGVPPEAVYNGWRWFSQVDVMQTAMNCDGSLYEIQKCIVGGVFQCLSAYLKVARLARCTLHSNYRIREVCLDRNRLCHAAFVG